MWIGEELTERGYERRFEAETFAAAITDAIGRSAAGMWQLTNPDTGQVYEFAYAEIAAPALDGAGKVRG